MSNEETPPDDSDRKRLTRLTKHRRKEMAEYAWLGRQLHNSYDAVLKEKVPDFLAALVEAFDSRPGNGATEAETDDDGGDAKGDGRADVPGNNGKEER